MAEFERNWRQVATDLNAIVDARFVIDDRETLRPYECDGLSVYREMPRLVVLPESVEQVCAVMAYCHRERIPVVVRGAGTSLSAGAMPHAEGIVLSMAKFTRVIEIDPASRLARVECGVRNLAISEAAAAHGLYYAPDPSSQIACTIGGNVAENSGGVHCLKYGLTVHNVLQATLVSVEGEQLTVGGAGLDSCGLDLLALVIGSEGMLGVVTDVTVKLLPRLPAARVVLGAFDDVERAGEAVSRIIGAGIIPAGLEMMDHLAIIAAEDYVRAGYPVEAQALLLCELDGSEAEVAESTRRVADLLRTHGATTVRVSQSEAERELLWKANVFHAGDGNLHPLILFDESAPGELERAEAFGAAILELCVRVGGCITGEHGVGMEKIRQVPLQFNDAELFQLGLIKLAFDPAELLNPGKGIPILRRCQEYRSLGRRAEPALADS
jgi:glycolate oxidase